MGNVIEVSGLNRSYGSFSLRDLSFCVPEDCITGFIGINGAGKTTTIHNLLNLTQGDSGSISLFGKDVRQHEREIKDRIGVVLDGGCFYDELSMGEKPFSFPPISHPTWIRSQIC